MIKSLKQQSKSRRDYLHKLYAQLTYKIPAIQAAVVSNTPNADALNIKLVKSAVDLKRFQELQSSSSYLYLKAAN